MVKVVPLSMPGPTHRGIGPRVTKPLSEQCFIYMLNMQLASLYIKGLHTAFYMHLNMYAVSIYTSFYTVISRMGH